ncbi:MAG: 3D domain-containing protein [Bacilli bacterium]|nr:3D domain-containing protein [Bacilli bacterium]MDD4298027.1 3D domain-containing protein [Bacilli bacterium]MDD4643680.1 3D domain-containing protein [Bacilli bacterium]
MKDKIPLWFKVVYIFLFIGAFHFFLPPKVKEMTTTNEKVAVVYMQAYNTVPEEKILDTFVGQLTGYGPDCVGCSGITASGYNVKTGNIYYYDKLYGKIRIVAADRKIPIGSIVRITASKIYAEPITAIVLDRGGAIKGNKMDLLFENEAATRFVGRQRNVKYEILRQGW